MVLDRLKALIQSKKIVFPLAVIVCLLIGGVVFLLLKEPVQIEREYRPLPVTVEEVRIGSLARKITAVGTLLANQTVLIRPEINGVIGKIYFKGGEVVREGETLFELDDRQIRAELKEAEAKLNFSKVEYDRASSLAAKNFGSQQKLDDAKAKLLVSEAAVESQKIKLDRCVLKAPFTGLLTIHSLSIGSVVGPDKELSTVVDISPMQVDFKIPAQYLKFISEGQRVKVTIDGYVADKPVQGIIANIDAKIDPNAHSVVVRALIPNKNALLRPGLFARVELTAGSKDNTMILSENSIMSNEGIEQVYKIFEGLAYKVDVRTGIRDGDSVEILAGLAPGDHIVYSGHAKIRDQTPVRYELGGKQYTFDKAKFDEKIKELESRKNALEPGKKETEASTETSKNDDKEVVDTPKKPEDTSTATPQGSEKTLEVKGPLEKSNEKESEKPGLLRRLWNSFTHLLQPKE